MDRLAQTALSAIRQMQDLKYDLAHNLANVNVPGFGGTFQMKVMRVFANPGRGNGKSFAA